MLIFSVPEPAPNTPQKAEGDGGAADTNTAAETDQISLHNYQHAGHTFF